MDKGINVDCVIDPVGVGMEELETESCGDRQAKPVAYPTSLGDEAVP